MEGGGGGHLYVDNGPRLHYNIDIDSLPICLYLLLDSSSV